MRRISPETAEAPDLTLLLRALECVDERGRPTVAGVLFFASEPQRWLADARISAARIPGIEPSTELSDLEEIGGNLLAQLNGAISFFDRHQLSPSRIVGWERARMTGPGQIPQEVLLEAVVNALAHRDYRAASQVRILAYDNRIEVINPGTLLNQLTLDSIRIGGISQRRNPTVAALLNRAAKRESLGVGIPDMVRILNQAGLPEPVFDLQGGHFKVVIHAGPVP
jgi:ATP-dependent DNA helicase RecG